MWTIKNIFFHFQFHRVVSISEIIIKYIIFWREEKSNEEKYKGTGYEQK